MANPAKDLLCHSAKKAGGQSENFAENQPDTIRPLTFTHRRYIAPGRTRLQGRGTQSVPRKKAISPYWEQSKEKNQGKKLKNFFPCNQNLSVIKLYHTPGGGPSPSLYLLATSKRVIAGKKFIETIPVLPLRFFSTINSASTL